MSEQNAVQEEVEQEVSEQEEPSIDFSNLASDFSAPVLDKDDPPLATEDATSGSEAVAEGSTDDESDEQPIATFDPEVDASAGYDVNSPEYRKLQSAHDKQLAKRDKQSSAELEALKKEIEELKRAAGKTPDAEQNDDPLSAYQVSLGDIQTNVRTAELFDGDDEMAGKMDAWFEERMNGAIRRVAMKSQEQQQAYEQQGNLALAQKYEAVLEGEVDPVGTLKMMEAVWASRPDLKADPQASLEAARLRLRPQPILDLDEDALTPAQLAAATQQLQRKPRNVLTRPTVTSGGTQPAKKAGKLSIADSVRLAIKS